MMKRTTFASILLTIALLAVPVQASEQSALDLASMSTEDLVTLRDKINVEIGNRGGDNVIGQGTYVVGTDIKACSFRVTPLSTMRDSSVDIAVYRDFNTVENDVNGDAYTNLIQLHKPEEGETPETAILNLKENQALVIKCGMAVIEENTASWMPDSGSTDN